MRLKGKRTSDGRKCQTRQKETFADKVYELKYL